MSRILITSGPTRQYLDPVRYLTNASSGRMGSSLAAAAIEMGHEVLIVTGPVQIVYPSTARIFPVVSTEEMLKASREVFSGCDGLIGAAAPSDYRPVRVQSNKISKTGTPLELRLVETSDVVATLGAEKDHQWLVGFALETEDHRFRAITKMERKSCDLMVLNEPAAMDSLENEVEILDRQGNTVASVSGTKAVVAREIMDVIQRKLIER